MSELRAFMQASAERVDGLLASCLPPLVEGDELAAAMHHIVFSGGKRLRPVLVDLAVHDVGGAPADGDHAAMAVELIHAYSLVHDDLPCMDDATTRRGKPCVHVVWGEAMAVLAGDALLTLAFEVLPGGVRTPDQLPMIALLAQASGAAGMVRGQVDDLAAEGSEVDLDRVRRIHAGKTAALIAASLELGALAGSGGASEQAARLGAAGRRFGMAFQIVDDLLDVQASSEELGKAAGADAERGKMTWPAVVGVERARADAEAYVAEALELAAGGRAEGLFGELGALILSRRA